MTNRNKWLIIRSLATIVILGVIFSRIDMAPLLARMHAFDSAWYVSGLCMLLLYVVIQAYILKVLLASHRLEVMLKDLVRMIFVTSFFGIFLPGSFGGDAVLCYALLRASSEKAVIVSAILFARIAATLAMLAIAAAVCFLPECPLPQLRPIVIFLSSCTAVGCLVLRLLLPRFKNEGSGEIKRSILARIFNFVFRVIRTTAMFAADWKAMLKIGIPVLMIGLMRIAVDYIASRSLGIHLPAIDFFIFAPSVNIATMLPLTLASLGIREGAYIYLFSLVGVSAADAMTISLTAFSYTVLIALAGGVLYVTSGLRTVIRSGPNQ